VEYFLNIKVLLWVKIFLEYSVEEYKRDEDEESRMTTCLVSQAQSFFGSLHNLVSWNKNTKKFFTKNTNYKTFVQWCDIIQAETWSIHLHNVIHMVCQILTKNTSFALLETSANPKIYENKVWGILTFKYLKYLK